MTVRTSVKIDELALPAVCGQTGRPFLMVVRRRGPALLELIRAVVIEGAPLAGGVPVRRATPAEPSWTFCSRCGHELRTTWNFCSGCGKRVLPQPDAHATSSGGENYGMSMDPAVSFQPLAIRARIDIGSFYGGCPYCRATGYFHCVCGIFSCWIRHNRKPHLDHADIWCGACQSWKCTSEAEDDNSLDQLTAYSVRKNAVDLQGRVAPGSATRNQIERSSSIRGYLE
jgi:hypothetical protein